MTVYTFDSHLYSTLTNMMSMMACWIRIGCGSVNNYLQSCTELLV